MLLIGRREYRKIKTIRTRNMRRKTNRDRGSIRPSRSSKTNKSALIGVFRTYNEKNIHRNNKKNNIIYWTSLGSRNKGRSRRKWWEDIGEDIKLMNINKENNMQRPKKMERISNYSKDSL